MQNLLKKYLDKLGLTDYSELTEVEKSTYKEWEDVLSVEVKIENVATFLERQVQRLQKELIEATKEGEDRRALLLAARIENYETIIIFIKEPQERRKSLERELLNNIE